MRLHDLWDEKRPVPRNVSIRSTKSLNDQSMLKAFVVDQLDALVGPALGLNSEDIAFIQKDSSTDPFLSKIYPRYPYTETRRHGFRTRLDRHDRYQ